MSSPAPRAHALTLRGCVLSRWTIDRSKRSAFAMLLRAAARRCAARPYLTSATMGRRMGAAPTTWWPKLDCAIAARPTIVPPPLSTWDLLDLNFRPVVNEPLDFTPHPGAPHSLLAALCFRSRRSVSTC